MKTISPTVVLIFLPLFGCIIIPVPTAEVNFCDRAWANNCDDFKTRGEITEETLEFMRPGTTTRQETLLKFGGPDSVWRDESIFAYQWLMVGGYVFVGVGAASPAGGMGGGGGSAAWFNKYVLLVEFDADNVVRHCVIKRADGRSTPVDSEFIEKWLAVVQSETSKTCVRSG
jgi:hypothetical protein